MRARWTDPVENMRTYIMVHEGIDRSERLSDVGWLNDVVSAAREVESVSTTGDQSALIETIDKLRAALRA